MNTVMVATDRRGTQQLYTKDFIRQVYKTLGFERFMQACDYTRLDEYNMDGTLKQWVAKEV